MRFGSVRSGRQDPNLAYPPPNSAGPGFFYYNGKGENRNGTLQGVGRQLIYAVDALKEAKQSSYLCIVLEAEVSCSNVL